MLHLAARMLKHGYLIASMTLFERHPIRQAAALCYRVNEGEIEILLITSRRSGRWGIPKGSIEGEESSHAAAAREAFEEAGVRGHVCQSTAGTYSYRKEGSGRNYTVTVHLLDVVEEVAEFEEMAERQKRWVSAEDAVDLVGEAALGEVIRQYVAHRKVC